MRYRLREYLQIMYWLKKTQSQTITFNTKNISIPMNKWAKDLNRHLWQNIQMTNEHMQHLLSCQRNSVILLGKWKCICKVFGCFFTAQWGMWEISSPTRDWTCTPLQWKVKSLNHWTMRKVPITLLLWKW